MYAVIRAIQFLGLSASGTEIRAHIAKQTDTDLEAAKVYVALARLEHQGLVRSSDEKERPAGRRGRPRRIYKLTASGLRALEAGARLYGNPVPRFSGVPNERKDGKKAKATPVG
jgi:DNA-binding PadR family transcriptional regulator